MEETPDIPDVAPDAAPAESRPYTLGEKGIAALGILGCALMAYVFLDILAGGRLTRALAGTPWEDEQ